METGLGQGRPLRLTISGRQNSGRFSLSLLVFGSTGLRWSATLYWLLFANPASSHLLSVFLFLAQCPWILILTYCATWAFLFSSFQLNFTNKRAQQNIQGLEEREIGGFYSPCSFSASGRDGWILVRPLSTAPAPPSMPPSLSPTLVCSLRPRAAFQSS